MKHDKMWPQGRRLLGSAARATARTAAKAAARLTVATARPYHPLGEHSAAKLARAPAAFDARWEHMLAALKAYDARSFCDLGCAEGHYVRGAAAQGLFAVGIDNDPDRLRRAAAVAILDDDWSAAFLQMDITPETVGRLPQFDAIACMSLLHHVIHRHGMAEARRLLRAIAEGTGKCLVFDMGGPDEVENVWAPSLSMLSGDVDRKISGLLAECGFTKIRIVGHTAGFDTKAERAMIIAEPA